MRPFRKEKVASTIRHIVGEALLRRMNDPRIATLTTVTRVEMTDDLLIARVYLSVPGSDAVEGRTLDAVRHASGFIQRLVAEAAGLRLCPQLRFDLDPGMKGARKTLELLAENRRTDPTLADGAVPADGSTMTPTADESDGSGGAPSGSEGRDRGAEDPE